jgi:GT2 family glycosyltransferase
LVDVSEQNPDYYILSPVHLNKEGRDFDPGFMQYALPPFCTNWFFDLFSSSEKDLYSTTFVNAAAWLIKRDTVSQIGFFDPLFFHYGEDKDYCNRILFHNKKIGIVTNSVIHHSREKVEGNKKRVLPVLKNEINRNYFLRLIELKRLDKTFSKLCIVYSAGLLFSSVKNILKIRFYKSLTDILTLGKLLYDIPAIISHRKECRKSGETFMAGIDLKSFTL